jgi:phospholipid/cholesterol/gamma-HCH transport system ATP-binding protein
MIVADLVEIEHLDSGFDDTQVLYDVSITVPERQVTVLVGVSGCGKTTLLKHMTRLHMPWSGSIRIFDRDILDLDEPEFAAVLKRIGVLFQNGALLNSISVGENVAIPFEQNSRLSRPLIDRLIKSKLRSVGLEHAIDRLPSELSGGMRKRAALARAIALDPALLLCDEPSAGLDPVTAASLDRLILRLRDQLGMTVLVVSHEVSSIKRIADRVIYLDRGRVLFQGSLEEAMQSEHPRLQDFFHQSAAVVPEDETPPASS